MFEHAPGCGDVRFHERPELRILDDRHARDPVHHVVIPIVGEIQSGQSRDQQQRQYICADDRVEGVKEAAAAQSPISLRLESDGLTQVMIYRVGQYGSFATREVQLLPGRYTVVGTRTGFRDVRREVVLPPGAPAAAVVVRCEEPI